MKQSEWPVYTCSICGQTISAPTKYAPSCEHVGTAHSAHKLTVMKQLEK